MEYKALGNYFYYTDYIAQGSFSRIYRGYRIIDRKPVAIKELTRVIDDKYIKSEISLMENLEHKNILKLYEVIRHKNNIYLILEYCNQGDLSLYINSKNVKYNLSYIYQIICALKYLYEKKIIHRDIKPQNILINNNEIKICDFGFAKKYKENDLINTFCGSPLYMAPEILKFNEYSEKADIWSLGVIIFEILFKHHPYPSINKHDLIKNIKSNDSIKIPKNKNINSSLINLLEGILNKDDKSRLSWEKIFGHKWFLSYNSNELFIQKNPSLDFESIFTDDEDDYEILTPKKRISYSVCHFNNTNIIDKNLSKSYRKRSSNKQITKLAEYEDCKVYSRSAPSERNNLYLENYININSKKHKEPGYKIIGSPPIKNYNSNLLGYLHKSVKTIKNLFKINI